MDASRQPEDPKRRRDLIVIGASAGGVEALRHVIAGLPHDLPAAVCVVLHLAPGSPSMLAQILQRAGQIPCAPARDGDVLAPGRVLVAPPDRHLVIEDAHVRLTLAPRENGHRPAVDALFRSAAEVGDGRVIGVVLSGSRDDGSAGLALIKAGGGAAVVQDPADALYAGMPASALAHVAADAVLPAEEIAAALVAMVGGTTPSPVGAPDDPPPNPDAERGVRSICPECGGVLSEDVVAGVTQWRRRVGHRYSARSLADAQAEAVEAAIWAAIRALEDRSLLLGRLSEQADAGGQGRAARFYGVRGEAASEHARIMRALLLQAAEDTLTGAPPAADQAGTGEPRDELSESEDAA